ncbi:MAG: O-antigen ligase domain-containing protein [Verrucomicrobia bacterium]|nr:O-antigen ligase domain-containing protein [Verrucomicrobiota bacterium]NBU11434.1 O-antigen ligase domain-containing protein [Pseudomonadota bacterium]NDA65995.1 O-antigen ligase domain-containing protein [Verrucomicrobiota bacterium]NDB74686.1 O-antigen ligase domain-containing protein [Verrucomicrobiota bacterium]NDD37834.1 O-antigen ligase domain-containing protein [Verrucomicrobiota bacterium]
MLAVCCAFYFCGLLWWQHRRLADASTRLRTEARNAKIDSAFLLLAFVCSCLWYVAGYPGSIAHGDCVVLLFGITIGQAIRAFCSHRPGNGTIALSSLLPALLAILSVAALVRPNMGVTFYYRERLRWTGPWDNPNTFGLLMGVGLTLALGWLWKRWLMRQGFFVVEAAMTRPPRGVVPGRLVWALLIASGACLVGLIMSFSRGAWVSTACAVAYLVGMGWGAAASRNSASGWRPSVLGRLAPFLGLTCVVLASVGVLAFWNFRTTEEPLVRRVFSVGNLNDFSWRNRVNSTIGALQIMGDSPLAGLGWNQPEQTYNELYRPFRLTEGMAIVLNDYFVVGMSLGIPAMICLLAYIGRRFARGHQGFRDSSGAVSALSWDALTCRAAFIVLLLGFIPERGLFYLAGGVPFWILLELGVSTPDSPHPSSTTAPRWSGDLVLLIVMFVSGLLWANARDPFQRADLTVESNGQHSQVVALRPSRSEPAPLLVFLQGRNDDGLGQRSLLRNAAELGFCSVLMEYQDGASVVDRLTAVAGRLQQRGWVKPDAIAVVASEQGMEKLPLELSNRGLPALRLIVGVNAAQAVGSINEIHAAISPAGERQLTPEGFRIAESGTNHAGPRVLVLSGTTSSAALQSTTGPNSLIHYQPVDEALLYEEQNRPLLVRLIAEYCADFFVQPVESHVPRVNSYWYFWVPTFLMLLAFIRRVWQRFASCSTEGSSPPTAAPKALIVFAWVLAIVAAAQSTVELGLPRLAITDTVTSTGRRLLVSNQMIEDYDFLISDDGWKGQQLNALLTHLELAHLQRKHFYPKLEEAFFRQFVLSPRIDDDSTEWGWRRELWENFYPRIRKERDVVQAAGTVVRFLRERVSIDPNRSTRNGVESCWKLGVADKTSFERVYVAALRSVGIAVRLDGKGIAELWTGTVWEPAPRPLIPSLVRRRPR